MRLLHIAVGNPYLGKLLYPAKRSQLSNIPCSKGIRHSGYLLCSPWSPPKRVDQILTLKSEDPLNPVSPQPQSSLGFRV